MEIKRCVCTDQSFADLVPRAREEGCSLEQLGACTGAGAQCGLCRPYLRCALATGQTVFTQLLPPEPLAAANPGQQKTPQDPPDRATSA